MPLTRFGPLQRGVPGCDEFGLYGLYGGLNLKDVGQEIPESDLIQALNGYLTTAGGFRMRGGMTRYATAVGGVTCKGLVRFFQQIRSGAVVSPAVVRTLAQVDDNLYNADTQVLIGSLGANSSHITAVRAQDPNDTNYPGGQTDVVILCSGVGGPYVYDGTNLYTPAGWSSAAGAKWCVLVNGIVWFGGIPTNPRAIFGTGDGIVASLETLPGYNAFVFSQPVTGLSALGTGSTASLIIGMNTGISTLSGTGPSTFMLQDVPSFNDGVVNGRAMVYEAGICYFLGRQAVYSFDGADPPQPISIKIEPWILGDPLVGGLPLASGQEHAFCFIHDNRLHLGYATTGGTEPNAILVYDLILKGWTVLQTTPGIHCAVALDAPTDPSPSQVLVGASSGGQIYNWDVTPDLGSEPLDDTAAITAICQTKYFKLGVPGTNKALTRLYPEFYLGGKFSGLITVQTDYGLSTISQLVGQPGPSGAQWDTATWDTSLWALGTVLVPFNAPASRLDFDAVQGEAFSFIVQTTGGSAQWILAGLTGVFKQLGRT